MYKSICLFIFLISTISSLSKEKGEVVLKYKGQFSAYSHYNFSNEQVLWFGGRYLPQFNAEYKLNNTHLIDYEASANIFSNIATEKGEMLNINATLKPYRAWVRYSTSQFEIRAGLQKINFGSASMLRPLMWFDQIDPRDPLKLTDGVWGVLGRYYFLNNANIWLWGLYGNENQKGWELYRSAKEKPELGGRIQFPVPLGEAGLSYHHRVADSRNVADYIPEFAEIQENRIGLDIRIDWTLGTWFESSWVHSSKNLGTFTNQEIFNLGFDYTFGIGKGLYVAFEQLLMAYDQEPFVFEKPISFSLLSFSYPIGLFDNLSAIMYYDWVNNKAYNFINYQHQFKNINVFIMGYLNPENYNIPTQSSSTNLFGGQGIQLMMVWNH